MSPTDYLKEALDYIQQNSLNRGKIDWNETWQTGLVEIASAQTLAETYPFIRATLARLGDRHSFFEEPETVRQMMQAVPKPALQPKGHLLSKHTGYLNLPAVIGNPAVLQAYAKAVQQIIREEAQSGAKGWLVDLRQNTGGNMLPMLAGVSSLLGTDCPGSFVYPDGTRLPWICRDGQVKVGDWLGLQLAEVLQLPETLPPLALLIGPQTASSGEILSIAFLGRPCTRSYGEATQGIPTCNDQKKLSDGALINLTVAWSADRTGQLYTGAIQPDQFVKSGEPDADLENDPVIKIAIEWLQQQFDE